MRTATPGLRERIADAAGRLFGVQRFHEVRMDDIAAEAGVSKGTLYRYFADKEDLYFALIAMASDRLFDEVQQSRLPGVPPGTNLCRVLVSMVTFFDRHSYFFDLLQRVEAMDTSGREFPWSKTRHGLLDLVGDLFRAHDPLAASACSDRHFHALLLLGAVRATIRFGQRPRPESLAEEMVDTFLYGVGRHAKVTRPAVPSAC